MFFDKREVEGILTRGWGRVEVEVEVIKRDGSPRVLRGTIKGQHERFVIIEKNRYGEDTIKRINTRKVVSIRHNSIERTAKGITRMVDQDKEFETWVDTNGWIEYRSKNA